MVLLGLGALDAHVPSAPSMMDSHDVVDLDFHTPTVVLHEESTAEAPTTARYLMARSYWERLALPIQLVVVSGVVWLVILIGLTLSDYLSRGLVGLASS